MYASNRSPPPLMNSQKSLAGGSQPTGSELKKTVETYIQMIRLLAQMNFNDSKFYNSSKVAKDFARYDKDFSSMLEAHQKNADVKERVKEERSKIIPYALAWNDYFSKYELKPEHKWFTTGSPPFLCYPGDCVATKAQGEPKFAGFPSSGKESPDGHDDDSDLDDDMGTSLKNAATLAKEAKENLLVSSLTSSVSSKLDEKHLNAQVESLVSQVQPLSSTEIAAAQSGFVANVDPNEFVKSLEQSGTNNNIIQQSNPVQTQLMGHQLMQSQQTHTNNYNSQIIQAQVSTVHNQQQIQNLQNPQQMHMNNYNPQAIQSQTGNLAGHQQQTHTVMNQHINAGMPQQHNNLPIQQHNLPNQQGPSTNQPLTQESSNVNQQPGVTIAQLYDPHNQQGSSSMVVNPSQSNQSNQAPQTTDNPFQPKPKQLPICTAFRGKSVSEPVFTGPSSSNNCGGLNDGLDSKRRKRKKRRGDIGIGSSEESSEEQISMKSLTRLFDSKLAAQKIDYTDVLKNEIAPLKIKIDDMELNMEKIATTAVNTAINSTLKPQLDDMETRIKNMKDDFERYKESNSMGNADSCSKSDIFRYNEYDRRRKVYLKAVEAVRKSACITFHLTEEFTNFDVNSKRLNHTSFKQFLGLHYKVKDSWPIRNGKGLAVEIMLDNIPDKNMHDVAVKIVENRRNSRGLGINFKTPESHNCDFVFNEWKRSGCIRNYTQQINGRYLIIVDEDIKIFVGCPIEISKFKPGLTDDSKRRFKDDMIKLSKWAEFFPSEGLVYEVPKEIAAKFKDRLRFYNEGDSRNSTNKQNSVTGTYREMSSFSSFSNANAGNFSVANSNPNFNMPGGQFAGGSTPNMPSGQFAGGSTSKSTDNVSNWLDNKNNNFNNQSHRSAFNNNNAGGKNSSNRNMNPGWNGASHGNINGWGGSGPNSNDIRN